MHCQRKSRSFEGLYIDQKLTFKLSYLELTFDIGPECTAVFTANSVLRQEETRSLLYTHM